MSAVKQSLLSVAALKAQVVHCLVKPKPLIVCDSLNLTSFKPTAKGQTGLIMSLSNLLAREAFCLAVLGILMSVSVLDVPSLLLQRTENRTHSDDI